jgi:hypothetical protein
MDNPIVAIDAHELKRLRSCEKAWNTVACVLIEGNPDALRGPGTGIDCALREIRRLQLRRLQPTAIPAIVNPEEKQS